MLELYCDGERVPWSAYAEVLIERFVALTAPFFSVQYLTKNGGTTGGLPPRATQLRWSEGETMNETPLTEELALALLRSWQPNSDLERLKLGDMQAPYEVGAVLRMLRAGHPGDEIRKFLNVRATKLMKILNDEMTREQHAHARGQVIYDSPIKAV